MGAIALDRATDAVVRQFAQQNPDFDILSFDFHNPRHVEDLIQSAVKAAKSDLPSLHTLRAYQRLLRVAPDLTLAEGLHQRGMTSATAIASMSSRRFVNNAQDLFGGDQVAARDFHARACHIKTSALHLLGSIKDLVAAPSFRSARFNAADPKLKDYFSQIPSYTSLFGNMDYFETDPGQTIFSPPAYFFDIMRIVDEYITYPNTNPVRTIPDGYTLEERRPDLFTDDLTPANAFNELPYLQLVNGVLANLIEQRPAKTNAYKVIALASYPFNLPFNLPLFQIRQALERLECALPEIYAAMVVSRVDPTAVQELDVLRETAGLSVTDLARLTNPDQSVAGVTAAYGYNIPYVPPPFPGNGLIGAVAGQTAVTGLDTLFSSQISVGDTVQIGNESHKVTAVTDNTHLVMDAAWKTSSAASYQVIANAPPRKPPFEGQGTVAIDSDNGTVTGTGTQFLTQVAVGDQVAATGQTRTVTAIASDTSLTVDTAWPYISAGLTYTVTPAQPVPPPPYAGPGGVIFEAASMLVAGVGTQFNTAYQYGGKIKIGDTTVAVSTVTSDTLLTVASAWDHTNAAAYMVAPAARTGTINDFLPIAGTGTLTLVKDSRAVTGTGTEFIRQLVAGDQIVFSGVVRTVTRVMSETSLELDYQPLVDATGQAFVILRQYGIDLVDTFLQRTGLTEQTLSELFTQNLDAEELQSGPASSFFINATSENLPSLVTYISNDPGNPTQRISNLSLSRLDRISRFVRLARIVGCSFVELQSIMTSTGATEITNALVMNIGMILQLKRKTGWEIADITALYCGLITTGRVDAAAPQDQFDLIFNPPALLQGQNPYADKSTVPFDPLRQPPQNWAIAGTDGMDGIIRNRLRAALMVNDADLTLLANYVLCLTGQPGAAQFSLTLPNLSWLYRLSWMAMQLGWSVSDYLTFLGLLYYPDAADYFKPPANAVSFALDQLDDQYGMAQWIANGEFGVSELKYIVTGNGAPGYVPGYDPAGIPVFIRDTALSAVPTRLAGPDLGALQLSAEQCAALLAQLATAQITTAIGIFSVATVAYNDVAGFLPVRVGPDSTVFGFNPASFVTATNGISETESRAVYAQLLAPATPILFTLPSQLVGVVQSFDAQTDLSFLASIFSSDPDAKIDSVRQILMAARSAIASLLNILPQKRGQQQSLLVRSLSAFVGTAISVVGALLDFAARESGLAQYLAAFLTPLPDNAPAPAHTADFVAMLSRAHRVVEVYRLDQTETGYITSVAGAPHFNITSWADVTIGNIRSIGDYAALRDAVGDRDDQLIAYFQVPATSSAAKLQALAAATGWNIDDITALVGYFWPAPAPDDADTVAGLDRLAKVFDIERRLGIRSATLFKLISISHLSIEKSAGVIDDSNWAVYEDVAQASLGIVNARFTGTARTDANQALQEAGNGAARDGLLGNVLWWTNARRPEIVTPDHLYKYLLLDVEMGACFTTSVIAQGIASVQLYLQRARMMQEPGVVEIDIPKAWWQWIMNYRVWEANRRIFLYPENYIEPSLRRNTTPEFQELSNDLLQNDPTKANVSKPFDKFIKALTILGSLGPVGGYQAHRTDPDSGEDKDTLFMIGRTKTEPYQFYFRALDNADEWGAWHKIDLSIGSDRLSPVYAFGRLFVFWTEFDVGKSNSIANQASNTETVDKASIKYAFYNNGEWTPVQTLQQTALIATYPSSYPVIGQPPVQDLLQKNSSYWQYPSVISTGEGMVGAGTISFTAGLGTVDGTTTQFEREIRAGDTIICFGERRVVGAVVDETSLVVTKPWAGTVSNAAFKVIQKDSGDRFRPSVGTGTVSTTSGMPLVSGTGTYFLEQIVYGDSIEIGGEVYVVITVQDDENLLVDRNWIGSFNNASYNIIPGRQDEENILICYSAPVGTADGIAFGTKVETPNPTKNSFIAAQNDLNASVYYGLWLASQYQPTKLNIPGYVPLSDCILLDQNLSRSSAKLLFTDYAVAAAANPQPYRANLVRQYSRVGIAPSTNLLWDNYWGTNLPRMRDSTRNLPGAGNINLLYNIDSNVSALISVANKPGVFLFDNHDDAFLIRAENTADISLLSDALLCSPRPWKPDLMNSQILSTGAYIAQPKPLQNTKFSFDRLTTSLMPLLQQRLFAGGVDSLLSLDSQFLRELPFSRFYPPPGTQPPPNVIPVASNIMDFDGAFGLYFWEIFFHSAFLVADRLQGNRQYEQALNWLEYVFNPTQGGDEYDAPDSPTRFWRFRPFREMTQPSLLKTMTDPRQIRRYNYDPFDPDAIASIRHVAYAKTIVMRYVDVVLDWADGLFTQYTRESITQAMNLYVFAENLLGKRPQSRGRLPLPPPKNFNQIKAEYPNGGLPEFLIDLENTPDLHPDDDNNRYTSQPVNDIIAYFSVPENADFLQYWDRVDDRLYKIRHCMNINGQVVPLALYAPPIDPALLVRAAAGGGGIDLASLMASPVPFYRFAYLVEKAKELCGQLASLSSSLLATLEKGDAEALSLLLNQQEGFLLKMTTSVKEQEIADAVTTGKALAQNLASAQYRQTFYETQIKNGISRREQASLDAMLAALIFNTLGTITKTAAAIGYAVPQVGSPFAMTYGGQQIGNALNAASGVFEIGAAISTFISQQTQVLAGYDRRSDDWEFQKNLAVYDVAQIGQQIASNDIRVQIAQQSLAIHLKTVEQSRDKEKFLRDKFTNQQLYQWMSSRLSQFQFQTYLLAYQAAQLAQRAYQYEYNTDRSFISFDYWDGNHKGLTAAEGLTLSLNQMEMSVLDYSRSLEIERTISLTQINPLALIQLKQTGQCYFEFDEALFDYDFPGHFARQIKSVAVSIPSVVGPYQNIKATLTQIGNYTVVKSDGVGVDAVNFLLGGKGAKPPPANAMRTNWASFQQVVLSTGQDDTGLFALNYSDAQYLPFEGTGAVSSWRLDMPMGTNRFSFDAISDVVITLRYTALDGGAAFRSKVARLQALKPYTAAEYISCRSMYFTAWQVFFSSVTPTSVTQTLSLPLENFIPAHVTKAQITGFYFRIDASVSAPGSYITINLTPTLSASLDLSAGNDETYRFSDHGQSNPSADKVLAQPLDIVFTLSDTPSSLKKQQGVGLNPDILRNIEIVFFYAGSVDL